MIKVNQEIKIDVEIFFEKVTAKQLVYKNYGLKVELSKLDELEENLLNIAVADGKLMDRTPYNYIIMVNQIAHYVELDAKINNYLTPSKNKCGTFKKEGLKDFWQLRNHEPDV
jgi:hypothetical protein